MKLDSKYFAWALAAAVAVHGTAQAFGSDYTISSLRSYFGSSAITAEPFVMVIVGVALIALRVLVARRSKRQE
jgi:hypothetical protein